MRFVPAKGRRRVTIVAIAVGATMLAGCRAVSRRLYHPPTVALRNIAVDGVGLTGGSLRVALLVRNPNFYALSSAGMRYQLLVGDSVTIATGVDSTHRRIGANDSTVVELPVQVSWQGLSAAGRGITASGLVPYQLVGTITLDTPLGTHDIPVNQARPFRAVALTCPQSSHSATCDGSLLGAGRRPVRQVGRSGRCHLRS